MPESQYSSRSTHPDRASYFRSLRDGLHAELTAANQRAEQSYASDARQSYALVVVDPDAAITRFIEDTYGKVGTRKSRSLRVDARSYTAGQTKGRTIQKFHDYNF